MTLDEAVGMLRAQKWRGVTDWGNDGDGWAYSDRADVDYPLDDAIAIARSFTARIVIADLLATADMLNANLAAATNANPAPFIAMETARAWLEEPPLDPPESAK